MAGLGILGAAASAAQLAEYGRGIILFLEETYKRIAHAPQQYLEYEAQLKLLIHTAENIARSPALQTTAVELHLRSTEVEVRALQVLLCHPACGSAIHSKPRRLWALIIGLEQRAIVEHLERLHKKNAQLSLYVHVINTGQISGIHRTVEALIAMMPAQVYSSTQSCKEKKKERFWDEELDTPTEFEKQVVLFTPQEPKDPSLYKMSEGPATEFGKIIVRGSAKVLNGDDNICDCLPQPCQCPPRTNGSNFIHISVESESCAVANGVVGPANGSKYGVVENSAPADGGKSQGSGPLIKNGNFLTRMGARAWFSEDK